MKNIKIFLLVILFSENFSYSIYANGSDSTNLFNGISLSYVPNGGQLGVEKYYLQSNKYKIIGSAHLIYQRFPNYYSSVGLIYSNSLRRTNKLGIYNEHGFQIGYLGSYYDFDMYKTKSDGSIVNIGRKWTSSMIIGYFIGLGYDFSKHTKINLKLFVKPGIYYRFPNNDNVFYLNNYSIEIGLIFHPKWFK